MARENGEDRQSLFSSENEENCETFNARSNALATATPSEPTVFRIPRGVKRTAIEPAVFLIYTALNICSKFGF